jgi:hypothetical protein
MREKYFKPSKKMQQLIDIRIKMRLDLFRHVIQGVDLIGCEAGLMNLSVGGVMMRREHVTVTVTLTYSMTLTPTLTPGFDHNSCFKRRQGIISLTEPSPSLGQSHASDGHGTEGRVRVAPVLVTTEAKGDS